MQGTLLWFNEEKGRGLIASADGEKIAVEGAAFPDGKAVAGRCKGLEVTFEVAPGELPCSAMEVTLVPHVAPRRARRRHGA